MHDVFRQAAAAHPHSVLKLLVEDGPGARLQPLFPAVLRVRHLPHLRLHVQVHGLPVFAVGVGPPHTAQLGQVAVGELVALLGGGLRRGARGFSGGSVSGIRVFNGAGGRSGL